MASRTLTPLRVASRHLTARTASLNIARTIVSASRPRTYAQSSIPSTGTTKPISRTPAPPSSRPESTTSSAPKPTSTSTSTSTSPTSPPRQRLPAVSGEPLPDAPPAADPTTTNGENGNGSNPIDWTQSYHGLGTSAFGPEVAAVLQAPLDPDDVEVKPDGIIYLPEIKYRRILNAAFGPGGWGLAPRADLHVQEKLVTREYALVVHGRFVAQARGEQQYFTEEGISTAAEGAKSNALMRCCKDLGIASELWDPRYIRKFMKSHATQQWVEHVLTKKRKQIWLRKDDEPRYPFKKT
ncbi:Mgm101p-domain-containing protein [Whalleya microplaca]|nr:Mgm101p-domain-containing protein [Whalleya microplaca]